MIALLNNAFLLLFVGNGLSYHLCYEWLISAHYRKSREVTINKRIAQILWIYRNIERNKSKWFYYDMIVGRQLYFDGNARDVRITNN